MAPVAIPKVLNGIFFMMLGLAVYWQFGLSRIRGWPLIAIFAVALLFFLYGLRLLWAWVEEVSQQPHEVVSGYALGTPVLLMAYVFLGGPALFFLWAAAADAPTRSGESLRLPGLIVGGALGSILVVLTYLRLRHWRYGKSTCRLTRPARVGGWLEAEIDCALPRGIDDTIVVRLRNYSATHRSSTPVWQMEERLQVPVQGKRTVVRMRLPVPRVPGQQLQRGGAGWLARLFTPAWILEIEKDVPGFDFHAQFRIPVYDAADPLAETPSPGSTQAPGDATKRRAATLITAAGFAAVCVATYQAGERGWLSTGIMQPSSQWLPRARFQREFDVWSGSHYPASIHGRCAEGREEYRSDWEPLPYGAGWYAWYAMDRGWFEKRSQEYGAQGFRLEGSSQFRDCRGVDRFQGTWMRRLIVK